VLSDHHYIIFEIKNKKSVASGGRVKEEKRECVDNKMIFNMNSSFLQVFQVDQPRLHLISVL